MRHKVNSLWCVASVSDTMGWWEVNMNGSGCVSYEILEIDFIWNRADR